MSACPCVSGAPPGRPWSRCGRPMRCGGSGWNLRCGSIPATRLPTPDPCPTHRVGRAVPAPVRSANGFACPRLHSRPLFPARAAPPVFPFPDRPHHDQEPQAFFLSAHRCRSRHCRPGHRAEPGCPAGHRARPVQWQHAADPGSDRCARRARLQGRQGRFPEVHPVAAGHPTDDPGDHQRPVQSAGCDHADRCAAQQPGGGYVLRG